MTDVDDDDDDAIAVFDVVVGRCYYWCYLMLFACEARFLTDRLSEFM